MDLRIRNMINFADPFLASPNLEKPQHNYIFSTIACILWTPEGRTSGRYISSENGNSNTSIGEWNYLFADQHFVEVNFENFIHFPLKFPK